MSVTLLRLKRQTFLNAARAVGFTGGNLFLAIEDGHVKLFTASSKIYEIPVETKAEYESLGVKQTSDGLEFTVNVSDSSNSK